MSSITEPKPSIVQGNEFENSGNAEKIVLSSPSLFCQIRIENQSIKSI